ncbi:hypothetical protein JCM8202_004183 [Rhodotorula sphaerocarpa]
MALARVTKIGVALVGPGLVGRLVLEQLTAPAVKKHFDVVAVSNSRYTVFQEEVAGSDVTVAGLLAALPPSSETSAPPTASTDSGCVVEQLSPGDLVAKLAHVGCRRDQHILLLDCTASDTYPKLYADAISSGLSVVTPNKVAFSSDETLYRGIVEAQGSSPYAGLYYFEGACGAGLPILTTLGDLVRTGDEVTRIEAVLSGTLSYIFNQFSKAPKARSEPRTDSFSEIVRRAHRDGHTEPHPAEDLSGRDVARKLAILARVSASGLTLPSGFVSIPTDSLIPAALADVRDPATFVADLAEYDEHFEKLRAAAAAEGRVLRYVGVLDPASGQATCGLRSYPPEHPFASLSGSHLSFAISSRRYAQSPLVVQGPGYPVEVTAAAVVADSLRVAERFGCQITL